jgi:hypothetical protein
MISASCGHSHKPGLMAFAWHARGGSQGQPATISKKLKEAVEAASKAQEKKTS